MNLPADENGLYAFVMFGMLLYLVAHYIARRIKTGRFSTKSGGFPITSVFDSATFSTSVLLLVGIVEPKVLELIGNTKPFLIIAGIAGVAYSVHALVPKDD
ncbi:hypothetical protein ACFOYU_11280 [Microvirga sp. GCM10011540]|uniref:hypothetical protein n=1 Tax=Microvirga sp. GCM10011540 TaxID=3317338 RepID=UPI00360A41F8